MSENPPNSVTADDTGKPVVDEEKNDVGTIADVSENEVHIDPDPDLTDDMKTLLGWQSSDEVVTVPKSAIERESYADLAVFTLDADALDRE